MKQPQETLDEALWTEVADATFACADGSQSQPTTELYVIRHKRSKEYFSYGHWTFDATDAQAFRSGVVALCVAQQCGLSNVELEPQSVAAQLHTIRLGTTGWH